MSSQGDDDADSDVLTSATSKPIEKERLPVILEPPLLVPSKSYQSAPLFHGSEPLPDSSFDDGIAEVESGSWKTDETGTGIVERTDEEIQMADEGPVGEEEWSWKYDEHGKKIWYRNSGSDVVQGVPEGHAGTVRFATRPVATLPPPTPKPDGYWVVDDRGSYLWYRFVETGQYVRDSDVERISEEDMSPDEQPRPREKLTWTGVGRYRTLRMIVVLTL